MKLALLEKINEKFCQYATISSVRRISNNILKIVFDKNHSYFIDVSKGNSSIFKKDGFENQKEFNAPFDVILTKRFSNSKIAKIYLLDGDKILRIVAESAGSYKKLTTILQFEFTGKYTNAIVLDENEIVLEALRHISENISSRTVKVGQKLEPIAKKEFSKKELDLPCDIDEYLLGLSEVKKSNELVSSKEQKLANLKKQYAQANEKLQNLPNKDEFLKMSQEAYDKANLILSNLHEISPNSKKFSLVGFDGKEVSFELGQNTPQMLANEIFAEAKKLRQKGQNCHIERENLEEKISHISKMINLVESANSLDELEFYFPKKEKNQKVTKKSEQCQTFGYKSYKIMVGRSSKENEWLLKNARAGDFWFHLKGAPSAHVIVPCTKKELPSEVIQEAAIICAKFSCDFGGGYEIDYTQRRNVKMQSGSNATYTEYKTIFVKI